MLKRLNNRKQKGFTIVELVIVIAVIAVLAAVLIPTFINLTAKANKAADESLVTNLNKALAVDEVDHEYNNMHDAVEGLKRQGYLASTLVTKSSDKLLFDQNTNRFLLETDKDDDIPAYEYWTIRDSYSVDEQEYSIYASDNFDTAVIQGLKVGFDAGDSNCVSSIEYVGVGTRRVVKIRTNDANTNLTINASLDTVDHYDEVGKVSADKIDLDHCYNEFGQAAYIKVVEGKVVAKDGGKIGVVFAANNDKDKVAVIKEEKGTIDKGLTVMQPVADTNVARTGGIALEYSIDGEHAASATQEQIDAAIASIEAIGELSVAANTGVQPVNVDYVAVVNYVGYNSLQEAITAAPAGGSVALLKDVTINTSNAMGEVNFYWKNQTANKSRPAGRRYCTAGLVIDKSIVIKGNNHTITTSTKNTTLGDFNGVSLAVIANNVELALDKLNITTANMSAIYVGENVTGFKFNVVSSSLRAASYTIKVCNGANNGTYNFVNSTLFGWAAVNTRSNNSTYNVNNCDLSGENTAAQSSSNNYASFVIDGDIANDSATVAGTYGSGNKVNIDNSKISATSASANAQTWLSIQYGATNNVVNADASSTLTSPSVWTYTNATEGATNTVKYGSTTFPGILDE